MTRITLLLTVCVGTGAEAQSVTIRGMVGDSVDGLPVSGAVVVLDQADSVVTGLRGDFWFRGVTTGRHTLRVAGLGYRSGEYGFSVAEDGGPDRDLV